MAAAMEQQTIRVFTESHTFTFTPHGASSGHVARVRVVNGHATHVIAGLEKPRSHFASVKPTFDVHDLVAGHLHAAAVDGTHLPVT
eukprot:5245740-Amphidinium_carterae.1